MSVNYHAFQSRGVPFAEYEVISQQWRSEFNNYNPKRIAEILDLETDKEWLYLSYYQNLYRMNLQDGHLEKQIENKWSDELYFNESMVIYHLLYYTKDTPLVTGVWVPSHTIDGVVSRNITAPDPLFAPFAKSYTGRLPELQTSCEKLGGHRIKEKKGDLDYQFEAFPFIKLRLVFWDADEDFPAQVQILVDSHITDFVHYETVGCMISDLLEKLEMSV